MKNKPEVKVTMKFAKKPAGGKTVKTEAVGAVEAIKQPTVSVIEEAPRTAAKLWGGLLNINRYWLILGAGVGLCGLAVWVGKLWFASPDILALGLLTIALFAGGGMLIGRQIKHRYDIGYKAIVNVGQVPGANSEKVGTNGVKANSLNIYATYNENVDAIVPRCIVFENVYEPLGQPQRCLNTNKDYYIHIWDIAKSKLVPFVLADRKYTDPSILARYLGLPSQRKYLRNRETLMKLIGPGLLAVAVIIGFIAIIALSE